MLSGGGLLARVRLIRTAGVGPVTYRQLISRFGGPDEALAAIPDLARRGGGRAPTICSVETAEREIAAVDRLGARYLVLGQGLYPSALGEIDDAWDEPLLAGRAARDDRP